MLENNFNSKLIGTLSKLENGLTDKDSNPVPATASGEKVCHLCVYCMSTYYFLFSNLKFI